jgi:glycosyltransferase 2 family protein
MKNWKLTIKILVTVGLFYLVTRRIDMEAIWNSIKNASGWHLLAAFLFYSFSRLLGAERLRLMLRAQPIHISVRENLRFYWVSMFYGMFLPGGIGADAYKVYYLKKNYTGHSTLSITKIMLWDRLIGLGALLLLALLPALILVFSPFWGWLWAPALIIELYVMRWAIGYWAPTLIAVHQRLFWISILIQLAQIASLIFLMEATGIVDHYLQYTLVFLASSLASMLPVSIGGVGIRELTFLYGSQYLGTSEAHSVASGFLFNVLVTALALTGSVFLFGKEAIVSKSLSGD